jgi:hypothetical protein
MFLFAVYMLSSVAIGVMSTLVRTPWTWCASAAAIGAAVVASSWPYLDVNREGMAGSVIKVLVYGSLYYLIPSGIFFAVPFTIGRLAMIARQRGRSAL